MTRTAAIAACLLCWAPAVRAMPPGADGRALHAAVAALGEAQVEVAAEGLAPVARRHPTDPDVLEAMSMVHFHRGDYVAAVDAMDEAIVQTPASPRVAERRALRELMAATRQATEGFVTVASADGRYVVRHAPGRDAVLAPYALDAMAASDRALSEVLGYRHPGPVRLEIYPSPAALARVSSLTVEEIERTGTIALCKWDRLMVTSPWSLIRGYPWLDTIGHEYVHLLLSRATRDRAPVWLQEGVAKFLERRWRGERGPPLAEPATHALLIRAAHDDALIPFDRLHPSIAMLPSQHDAALAFAQVATFVGEFVDRYGAEGLRDTVARVAAGADARDALAAVAGEPFDRIEERWQRGLRAQSWAQGIPPRLIALQFRRAAQTEDESAELVVEAARAPLRLGDLLWDRGRPAAAAAEYGRAVEAAPDDPIVVSRFARASLTANRGAEAVSALRRIRELYPTHAPAHALLGACLLAQGNRVDAREPLREALRINPFDPEPHCALAVATDDDGERRREQRACRALGGTLR